MKITYIFIFIAIIFSSCLTGGFDENEQLDRHNAALAKAPKIESVKVNGTEVQRNTVSRRVVDAKIGDVLNISAELSGGLGAQLQELEFSRIYYYGEDFEEDPKPVDPDSDGLYDVTGNTTVFDYVYTVPEEDDDGFHFDPGYVIQVYFRAKNSLGNYGYRAIEIHIVE